MIFFSDADISLTLEVASIAIIFIYIFYVFLSFVKIFLFIIFLQVSFIPTISVIMNNFTIMMKIVLVLCFSIIYYISFRNEERRRWGFS